MHLRTPASPDPSSEPNPTPPAAANPARPRHTGRQRVGAAIGFGAVVTATAVAGGATGPRGGQTGRWFRSLEKPSFQPPDAVFGPVWTALYPTIAIAGWRIWDAPPSPERDRALRWWTAQMAANAAWTPVFFGLRRPPAALAVLAAQLTSTAALVRSSARVDAPTAALLGPYLGWSAFAFALNEEIVRRNR